MNTLKEIRIGATTTKTITTLFICGSLLVGFMSMSLSFSQTAMAQRGPPVGSPSENRPTPQCESNETFRNGECIPLPRCPVPEIDGECAELVKEPVDLVCPVPEIEGECAELVKEPVDLVQDPARRPGQGNR